MDTKLSLLVVFICKLIANAVGLDNYYSYNDYMVVRDLTPLDTDEYTYSYKRQSSSSFPSLVINDLQSRSTVIPAGLNVCIQTVINPTNGTYCFDSTQRTRSVYELDCTFPFQYKGLYYDVCIQNDSPSGAFWCSLDGVFAGKYAFCQQACPLLARNRMVGVNAGKTHSSCLVNSSQAVSLFPNQTQISEIISVHNSVRAGINAASDLMALQWDNTLGRIAQRKAMTCTFAHDCGACRAPLNNASIYVGQNVYMSTGYSQLSWTAVIAGSWASESKYFKFGGPQLGTVGHFTQVVSNLTVRVGCGAAKCGASMYAYCNYATGQYSYDTPYTVGSPCAMCPGQCQNNLCTCSKLCQNGGKLNLNTCTCSCPSFTSGSQCETLVCSQTDAKYGCWTTNPAYCQYSNIPSICPNLCKICKLS